MNVIRVNKSWYYTAILGIFLSVGSIYVFHGVVAEVLRFLGLALVIGAVTCANLGLLIRHLRKRRGLFY